MASKRKTVEIEKLKAAANVVFRESRNDAREARRVLQRFIEDQLFAANVYRGFRYLEASDNLVEGYSLGLIRGGDGKNTFPDDSRIAFL